MINIQKIKDFINNIEDCYVIDYYNDYKIVFETKDNPIYSITKDYLYDEFFNIFIYDSKNWLKYIKNNIYKNILINKQNVSYIKYKKIIGVFKQYNELTLEEFIILGINNNLKMLDYLYLLPEDEQTKLQYLVNANKFDLI